MSQSSLSQELTNIEIRIKSLSTSSDKEKEDALRTFLRLWEQIPPEWKKRCKSPPSDRLKVAQWKTDPISVPRIILTQLELWDQNPSSILTSEPTVSLPPSQDFLSRLYLALDHTQFQSSVVKAIRLRILQIAFHNLMNRLNVRHLYANSTAESEFLNRIKVGKDDTEFGKRSKGWAATGGKYASLSTELGGLGSMICMPDDISAYKLERIPSTGEVRKEVVARLKARGINDPRNKNIQRCYIVGQKILAMINAELDSYFLEYASPQADVTLSRKRRRRTQITDVPEPLTGAIGGAGANPQVDKPDNPRQRPENPVASYSETSNASPTREPILSPLSFATPPVTRSNLTTLRDPQLGLWGDMTNSYDYWNDMTDMTSEFWNDMDQVGWAGVMDNLSGTVDSHLLNPRSMDSSVPGPINSSEVLPSIQIDRPTSNMVLS